MRPLGSKPSTLIHWATGANNDHYIIFYSDIIDIIMDIHIDIPLKNHLTMRLGGVARFMTDIHSPEEAAEAVKQRDRKSVV